ncbi:MAG TPA: MFS transporter [Terracidiphilus sp.]|nr:MFS transporter [Terracidiphilus sp.]
MAGIQAPSLVWNPPVRIHPSRFASIRRDPFRELPLPSAIESPAHAASHEATQPVSAGLLILLAVACGLIVANIYYVQPLAGPIGHALGISPAATGLIVTLTQIGYGLGLLFVVPLGDLHETRRLVLAALAVACASLLAAAVARNATVFLLASLVIGVSSTAVQILVPYAAHLAPPHLRGRTVGQVMSGLLIGIMLSRPAASFLTDLFNWAAIFYIAAGLMALLALVLALRLPPRRPPPGPHYFALLVSMAHLYRTTPVLRRRAAYQALLFGAFTLFWTVSPLLLASPLFGLSQRGIALFALVGVAGALAAPLAGHLGDRGHSRAATGIAMISVFAGFLLTRLVHSGSFVALSLLTLGAILLDFGVSSSLVIGQRAIYTLRPEYRSRLNGLFMATFFAGGAVCSALGGWAYARGGWNAASWIGLILPLIALAYFATEPRA